MSKITLHSQMVPGVTPEGWAAFHDKGDRLQEILYALRMMYAEKIARRSDPSAEVHYLNRKAATANWREVRL